MSAGKCEAVTQEGKRCTIHASAEVGGKHFCGNHANKARATQLMHRDPRQEALSAAGAPETSAEDFLKTLRTLMEVKAPDFVLVQMLQAWKAGHL